MQEPQHIWPEPQLMKISTMEFITLIKERPALWQRTHPHFNNRPLRNERLVELGTVAGTSAICCSKKMKNLKDSMRQQVLKLPRTVLGMPDFNCIDNVTWPYFKPLLFMKEEFFGRNKTTCSMLYTDYANDHEETDKEDGNERSGDFPMEEFIDLIKERPVLWEKSNPDFSNRSLREQLLKEVCNAVGTDVITVTKKLKMLKDKMRRLIKSLPKLESGLPDFKSVYRIPWPYFTQALFMRHDLVDNMSKKVGTSKGEIGVTEETCQTNDEFHSDDQYYMLQNKTSHIDSDREFESSASIQTINFTARSSRQAKRPRSHYVHTDELDMFALDIANDLRKIKDPLRLMQAKSKIRRIAEDLVMSELLPSPEGSTMKDTSNSELNQSGTCPHMEVKQESPY